MLRMYDNIRYQVHVPSVPCIHIMCVFPSEEFLPMEKFKVCLSSSTQPRTWETTNYVSLDVFHHLTF